MEPFAIKLVNKSKLSNPKPKRKNPNPISEKTFPKKNEKKFTLLMKNLICQLDTSNTCEELIIGSKKMPPSKGEALPKRPAEPWKLLKNLSKLSTERFIGVL